MGKGLVRRLALLSVLVLGVLLCGRAFAAPLDRETLQDMIVPPYALREPVSDEGVWTLLNSGGAEAGYVFETGPLAPLPGFSGAPINMLVTIDRDGRFLNVRLISHNEPIFVSGLGEAPLCACLEQYRGHSIREPLVSARLTAWRCRYLCSLGALMALGGLRCMRPWIPRRAQCGSPCQLCRVRCPYGAIRKTGEIAYSQCFQCLDCVSIHDDAAQCVPLAARIAPPLQKEYRHETAALPLHRRGQPRRFCARRGDDMASGYARRHDPRRPARPARTFF